jgi:hypothetical protein
MPTGHPPYPARFRADAVQLVATSGTSGRPVAVALGLATESVRRWLPQGGWPPNAAARAAGGEWIAGCYHRPRRHSRLGDRTPVNVASSQGQGQAAERLLVSESGSRL